MGKDTKIEWTDHTFNPWWGCVKVGAGCQHCYAETLAHRFGHDVWGLDTGRRFFGPGHWLAPYAWAIKAKRAGTRARVFCGSMCDWAERYPKQDTAELQDTCRARLFGMIEKTPALDWLLLTKRPGNVLDLLPQRWTISGELPRHVWLGLSASTSAELIGQWEELDAVNSWSTASILFLSLEPLLGDVAETLEELYLRIERKNDVVAAVYSGETDRQQKVNDYRLMYGPNYLGGLSTASQAPAWVIVGAETGPGARRMDPAWAYNIMEVCRAHNVPFFMKQLTNKAEIPPDLMVREFPKAHPLPVETYGTRAWFAGLERR